MYSSCDIAFCKGVKLICRGLIEMIMVISDYLKTRKYMTQFQIDGMELNIDNTFLCLNELN